MHCFDESLPLRGRGNQLLPACRCQAVISGATPVRRRFPLCGHPPLLQQPLEGGVEGPVIDHEFLLRLVSQKLRDSVGVVRPDLKASQDEYFQRPLQQIEPVR